MKKELLIQILIISLIITIYILSYKLYILNENYVDLESSNLILTNNVTSYRNKYNDEYLKNKKYESQISFMDKHVAICPTDGTGLYHKYNCDKLKLLSYNYYIYNIEQAPQRGFKPCSLCSELDNTQNTKTEIVYVTNTGEKYHRSWCSYLKSKNPIDKDSAISKGYSACSRCNP